MSSYQEFTGKSVEEALKAARDEFGVSLQDLDFEILTPGSRGVLGMGAEPARIVAAPRSALGGAAPKREAAEAKPRPPAPPRDDRYGDRDRDRGPRRDDRGGRGRYDDRGPRRDDRPRTGAPAGSGDAYRADRPSSDRPRDDRPRDDRPRDDRPRSDRPDRGPRRDDRPPRRDDRAGRGQAAAPTGTRGAELSASEIAEVTSARGSVAMERAELAAAEATPEALETGREILETLMAHLGFTDVTIEVRQGETSRLNVVAGEADRDSLGSLIGRKGERLSALQHLVNLLLSRKTGEWTRVLVDVEDYRGRRERQLQELAQRAADRVNETGRMIQLEPMPALERRWVHLALREIPGVTTQSIGEEPNRRIVVLPATES
jgi:spoIIIJ-associated protein